MKKTKQGLLYALGLLLMAFGIVLITKGNLGVSPMSSVPFATANITPLSFGVTSALFYLFCALAQIFILKKFTVSILLQIPLAFAFGGLVGYFSDLISLSANGLISGVLLTLVGMLIAALGIALIATIRLILPPPDALMIAISDVVGQPLSRTKTAGDITFVCIAFCIEFFTTRTITAIGLGTVMSMCITGSFVGLWKKYLCEPLLKGKQPAAK